MATTWRFDAVIAAPPGALYDWMSDYREDDHSRAAFKRGAGAKERDQSSRRIVSREGNRIVLEDHWGRNRMMMDVQLVPESHEIRLRRQWGYEATWRALPEGERTRVVVEGKVAPGGIMRLLAPLFAKGMLKQMRADFDGHIADMRESLER